MRKTTAAAVLLLGATFAADAWGQGEAFGARARRWRTQIDGDLQANDSLLAGSNFDVRATADMDEEVDLDDFAVMFGFPGLGKLNLQYWQGGYEGETTLTRDLVFDGMTFTGGTAVDTALDWRVGSILMEYNSPGPWIFAGNAFAVQTGLKYVRVRGGIDSATASEEATFKGYLPVVGMRGRIAAGQYFGVEVEANGLLAKSFELAGVSGILYDVSLSGQVAVSGFHAGLGYRWFHLDAEDERGGDTTEVDVMIDGFFVEIGYKM